MDLFLIAGYTWQTWFTPLHTRTSTASNDQKGLCPGYHGGVYARYQFNHQLVAHLAEILHRPRYAKLPASPLDLYIHLFKDKRGALKQSNRGALTLPMHDVGVQFLEEYGERPSIEPPPFVCFVKLRRIKFSPSTRNVHSDVQSITRRPDIDPRSVEEREEGRCFCRGESSHPNCAVSVGMQRPRIFNRVGETVRQRLFSPSMMVEGNFASNYPIYPTLSSSPCVYRKWDPFQFTHFHRRD